MNRKKKLEEDQRKYEEGLRKQLHKSETLKKGKTTPFELLVMIHNWLDGDDVVALSRNVGRASHRAGERIPKKLAWGYPPYPERMNDWYSEYPPPFTREVAPFSIREKMFIKWWYDMNVQFANDPAWVELIHKAERTKDWNRPTVKYICRVLQRPEQQLRDYVFATYLQPGLVETPTCPIPEWIEKDETT